MEPSYVLLNLVFTVVNLAGRCTLIPAVRCNRSTASARAFSPLSGVP